MTHRGLVIGLGLPFLYFVPVATMWFCNLSRSRRADVLGSIAARGDDSVQDLPADPPTAGKAPV